MKKLTKTGEEFIRTICEGDGNSLISGKYNYNLSFSTVQETNEIFTANATDLSGNPILTNEDLGEALISWYNTYAELVNLDANILAAQGYAESKYNLWHYGRNTSGSGLADLLGIRVYRHIVQSERPQTVEALASPRFTTDEINLITNGLTDADLESSYIYRGRSTTTDIAQTAINNRLQLHLNIINNPAISIKAQAVIMSEISKRNSNLTTNTLFAYNRNYLASAVDYPTLVDNTGRKYGDDYVKVGIDYVDIIFRYLSDKNNDQVSKPIDKPRGIWFGFETDFEVDSFKAFLG